MASQLSYIAVATVGGIAFTVGIIVLSGNAIAGALIGFGVTNSVNMIILAIRNPKAS